ncbi:MAG: homocysteine methyltransferase [Acidobacteria bacterium]|nr:homocysteine methyltransferase [Acidobacteriota bacterium]|tara:strand:- start:349 stop:1269 length:921 start_codon:yes stop_codon:yes gene_type:complete
MTLVEALAQRALIGDGAMGTQLQLAGLPPGGCGEAWNLDRPDRVLAIHRAYVEAGADCLTTNTFGGCRISLARHREGARTTAINQAAATIAREAFGGHPGFVIGDIGPFGGLMEPLGDIAIADVEAAFTEQAEALVGAGVDAIIVESQTALEELEIGIAAARAAGAEVVIGSMAFDRMFDSDDVRTMMGVSPEQAARFMVDRGAGVVGTNCGTGVNMLIATSIVARYRAVCDLPIMVQANAGQPVLEQMQTVYKQTPAEMADGVAGVLAAGARIVGACCGSTPSHIRAVAAAARPDTRTGERGVSP